MKYHELRLRIPSDDGIKLDLVQEKIIEAMDAKGIEVLGAAEMTEDPGNGDTPQGEMKLARNGRRRILWPATEVLQHAGRAFSVRATRQKAK